VQNAAKTAENNVFHDQVKSNFIPYAALFISVLRSRHGLSAVSLLW
jgi:hypothetical protein